jgi:hypothetical protein
VKIAFHDIANSGPGEVIQGVVVEEDPAAQEGECEEARHPEGEC